MLHMICNKCEVYNQATVFAEPEKSFAKTFEILTAEGPYRILSAPYRALSDSCAT